MRGLSNLIFLILLFLLHQTSHLSCACNKKERLALLKFKASFTNTTKEPLGSWKGSDCCVWKGVECDGITGQVIKLDFRPYESGEASHLSSSLLELEHLNHLDLSFNSFNFTPMPEFIGSMKHLTYLNLSNTDFHGRIPHHLGNLSNLVVLDLSIGIEFNQQDLYDDDLGWLSRLSSLKHLLMSAVHLNKAQNLFQVLLMLPSLSHVEFKDCELNNTHILQGHLPLNSLFLPNVELLDLSQNNLAGPIPDAFQNMTAITYLDLSDNDFTSVPQSLGKLNSLVHLYLTSNSIKSEGSILSILRNMCSLRTLDLSKQNIRKSSVSLGRGELSGCSRYDLEDLLLGESGMNGNLPNWLGQLKNLRTLDLSNNFFYGQVPSSLGQLVNLSTLKLSSNFLEGTFSEVHLKNLSYIQTLDIGFNKLDVKIDSNWTPPFQSVGDLRLASCNIGSEYQLWIQKQKQLGTLDLFNNNIGGTIPTWIPRMSLRQLDLSQNKINGTIPKNFGEQFPSLGFIDLSNNEMSGSIPENFADQDPNLWDLILADNLLEGPLPKSLCDMEFLEVLDVSNNKLSGEIPNCWKTTRHLQYIDLSSNKLSGTIPSSFGNVSWYWLKLSNNSLHGDLQQALENIYVSEILDLGENQFTGMITSKWIDLSKTLVVLRLSHNMLSGEIPYSICNLSSLQILDLASNNLSGSIPSCVCNLTGMTNQFRSFIYETFVQFSKDIKQALKGSEQDYTKNLEYLANFDLSDNNLEGFIPEGITCLTGLIGLNLSHNKFSGIIPSKIDEMKSLESLDLSNNKLYGSIPINMPILTSLSVLNLSNNNFSGRIPKGAQFFTFDASSYGGNPYLCGDPLSNACPGDHGIIQTPTSLLYEDRSDNNEEEKEKILFYFVIAAGYITGFWGIIGVLLLKRNWRNACFRRVEEFADTSCVEIATRISRVKKMINKKSVG